MTDPFGLWLAPQPLVLASRSRARAAMLGAAGIPVEIAPSRVDERALERIGGEGSLAARLAAAKALDVSARRPGRLVLGADQTLTLAGEALHKPAGRAEAAAQLARMAGRSHVLTSAAAVAHDGRVLGEAEGEATIRIRDLDASAIDRYLDVSGPEVLGSVGAYHVEALGAHLFAAIEGDHYTIMGLPLLPLLALLRGLGAVAD
jgi:septum formation protein